MSDEDRWKQMYEIQRERADRLHASLPELVKQAEMRGLVLGLKYQLPAWGHYGRPYEEYIRILAEEIVKDAETKGLKNDRNRDPELADAG